MFRSATHHFVRQVKLALCARKDMRVTTNIRKTDLVRFNLAILPKLKSTYITILVIALFVFGFICWKNGIPQTQNNWIAILTGSFGGGLFGMLFGVVFSMISILLMSSSKNGILGEGEKGPGSIERTNGVRHDICE